MWKKDIYVNRFESVIFAMKMYILQTRTYCKGGDPMELNFEGLEMPK